MGFTFGSKKEPEPEVVASGSDIGIGDASAELRNFRKQHKWDPFLEVEKLDNIDNALQSGDVEKQAAVDESLIQEDSPYPEVRAAVSNWLDAVSKNVHGTVADGVCR